jgi:hypothetical protein
MPQAAWYNPRMTKKMTLDSLAALVSKGYASAEKKFTALAEGLAKLDSKINGLDSKVVSLDARIVGVETNLAWKITHLNINKKIAASKSPTSSPTAHPLQRTQLRSSRDKRL